MHETPEGTARGTVVVVCDSGHARLLALTPGGDGLVELEALVSPGARLPERDKVTDRPGRSFDCAGPGRHAVGGVETAREHEAPGFAREVAARIERARTSGEARGFVLVAPPEFLGLLRERSAGERGSRHHHQHGDGHDRRRCPDDEAAVAADGLPGEGAAHQ